MSTTCEQANELMEVLTRRHQDEIEHLTKLFASAGGLEVFDLASKVIGSPVSAARWLTSSHVGLNGAIPAVLALHADGREAVRTYLQQIEHGVYI